MRKNHKEENYETIHHKMRSCFLTHKKSPKNNLKKPVKSVASLNNVNSHFLKNSVKHHLHPKIICEYE